MPEYIKLPFRYKNIFIRLQNLERNGFLRSIFIELLKADKIKNIIPSEYQINQTKENFLKYNIHNQK